MNVKKKIKQLTDCAQGLNSAIEEESWDEAMLLSQQWDTNIRDLFRSLSTEQFTTMKSELEEILDQNVSIRKHLMELRAKVLTQIQENNNNRSAIQLYNHSI